MINHSRKIFLEAIYVYIYPKMILYYTIYVKVY